MSGTGPRESIFPTRMALTNTKTRLKGAQTGHSLLAKKRDALTTRFRAILRKVDDVSSVAWDDLLHHHLVNQKLMKYNITGEKQAKRKMGRVMQLASFSLAEVTYATGDIAYLVHQQAKSASFKVRAKQENVSGVVLPAFEVDRVPGTGMSWKWLSPPPIPSHPRPILTEKGCHLNLSCRLQPDWPWARRSAGVEIKGGVRKSGRDARRARIAPDGVHDSRRGHSRNESPGECHRACHHSPSR